jgi:hypothetical protein
MSIKNRVKQALLAVFNESLVASAARQLRRIKYGGSSYECPCCGMQFRVFLPGIDSLDPNRRRAGILCPECNSLTRQRLLYLYLRDELNAFNRPGRILHVAPERSLTAKFLERRDIEYISTDLDPSKAAIRADLTNIFFRDDTFDLVICSHVLEHIPEDRMATRELIRILKPGGTALLMVPIDASLQNTYEDWNIQSPADRLRAFGQQDHVRIYGLDFVQRLLQPGTTIEEVKARDFVSAEKIDYYRLDPEEQIFVCRKCAASS